MKTTQPTPEDAPLGALLQEWKELPALPPRFQEQVWRRIQHRDVASTALPSFREALAVWLAQLVPRPAFAVAGALVLLAVGATAGWTQARLESARMNGDLRARYVQAVDPYQANP